MGNICVKGSAFSCTPYICLAAVFVFPQGFLGRCAPWRAVSHVHDSKRVRGCVILTLFMLTLVFVDGFGFSFRPCRRRPWLAISGGCWAPWSTQTSNLSPAAGPSTHTGRCCRAKASTSTPCSVSGARARMCAFQRRRSRHVSGWEKATNTASGG